MYFLLSAACRQLIIQGVNQRHHRNWRCFILLPCLPFWCFIVLVLGTGTYETWVRWTGSIKTCGWFTEKNGANWGVTMCLFISTVSWMPYMRHTVIKQSVIGWCEATQLWLLPLSWSPITLCTDVFYSFYTTEITITFLNY